MNYELPDEYSDFKEKFASGIESHFKPGALKRDIHSSYPDDIFSSLQNTNLDTLWNSQDEVSLLKLGLVLEKVASADPAGAILILSNYLVPAVLLKECENADRFTELAENAKKFKNSIGLAIHETTMGTDFNALSTYGETSEDKYYLQGEKSNIPGAKECDYFIVASVDAESDQLQLHVIDKRAGGVTIDKHEEVLGLRSAGFGNIQIQDVEVKSDRILSAGSSAQELLLKMQKVISLGTAFIAFGLSQSAYKESIERALKRRQFNRAIFDFQAVQLKLSKMYTDLMAVQAALYSTAGKEVDSIPLRESLGLKVLSTNTAMESANETVQIFAGYGYIKNNGIDRYMRDSKVLQVFPDSNEVLQMQIASELKDVHSKQ